MKRLFIILGILVMTLPVAAQHMLIEKSDSNSEIVSLEKLKQITFSGTTVNVELTDGTKSSTGMSDIYVITFGDYTTIGQIRPEGGKHVAYISSDEIAIDGKAGSHVTIYNATGTQVLNTCLSADYGHISIANLPKGIYIVKCNERTAKIVKR